MSYWFSQSTKTNTHWQSGQQDYILADGCVGFVRVNEKNYSLPMIFGVKEGLKAYNLGEGWLVRDSFDITKYETGVHLLQTEDVSVIVPTSSNKYSYEATNVMDNSKVEDGAVFHYVPKMFDPSEDVVYNMVIPKLRQFLIVADMVEGKSAVDVLSDELNKHLTVNDFFHKIKLPKGSEEWSNENVTANITSYKAYPTYGGGFTYNGETYVSAGYSSVPKAGGLISPNVGMGAACLGFISEPKSYYFCLGVDKKQKDDDTYELVYSGTTQPSVGSSNMYYETDTKVYALVYDEVSISLKENVTQIKRGS